MKKALIVAGGWDGHEPEKCAALFADLLREKDYEVEVSDTLDVYLDEEKMKSLDLIVPIWTMGTISDEQEKGLLEAVKSGVGLAGFHGGMGDSFRGKTGYEWVVGGHFVSHPGDIKDYEVNIIEKDDPIVQGLNDFKMHSEQYYMLTDPGNRVLATMVFDGEGYGMTWLKGVVMPVVWTRQWFEGRVFYSSLGHVAADFDGYEARELTVRGMLWASR